MAEQAPRKGERTRLRILASALDLFTERGFTGTSVRDIAARAGMTHAGLLHHFPTKAELLSRILEFREQQEVELIRDRADADPLSLFAWSLRIADLNAGDPDRMSLFVKLLGESTDPEHPAHEYFRNRYRSFVDTFEPAFADAFGLRPPVVPIGAREAAHEYLALLDGLQYQVLADLHGVDMVASLRRFLAQLGIEVPREEVPEADAADADRAIG